MKRSLLGFRFELEEEADRPPHASPWGRVYLGNTEVWSTYNLWSSDGTLTLADVQERFAERLKEVMAEPYDESVY